MKIEHWMLFGTFAEQRYFAYPKPDSYRGVIINGNMASHAPDGLAAFLLEKTKLPYLIDPMTHAFQHDPSFVLGGDGEPKKSILAMAQHYDGGADFLYKLVGKKPLLPSHLKDDGVLKNFVIQCLKFQRTILSEAMQSAEAMKYLLFDEPKLSPYALVAPYFHLTESNAAAWLPIQLQSCKFARQELGSGEKLFMGVVLSQGLLNSNAKALSQALLKVDVDGYLLWVDDLDEQQAGLTELMNFLQLARSLRESGKREVINLHGGYFSILAAGTLGQGVLSGVTHAPEFGEYRSVVPVGGGIPIARYYIPQLHSRVRYRDAVRLFTALGWFKDAATFHKNVCSCQECKDTLDGDAGNFVLFGKGTPKTVRRGNGMVRIDFPTTETKVRCLKHYLQRKQAEYEFSANDSASVILQDLQNGKKIFEDYLGDGVAHLDTWQSAFKSIKP